MQKAITLLILFALIPMTMAIEPQFIFETNKSNQVLTFKCTDSILDEPCGSGFTCNITINYPNSGNLLANNTQMNRIGSGNYNFSLFNLYENGYYPYKGVCTNGSDSATSDDLFFLVRQTGSDFNEAQGLTSLGIIIGVIFSGLVFLIFGFKLSGNSKTMPIALIFFVMTIFMVLYALQLGFTFATDILEYESLANMQTTIYTTILFIMSGLGVISVIFMLFAFVKLMGNEKKIKNYGEGFDPINETYNY